MTTPHQTPVTDQRAGGSEGLGTGLSSSDNDELLELLDTLGPDA